MAHFVKDTEKLIHMLNIMILKDDKKTEERKHKNNFTNERSYSNIKTRTNVL